MKWDSEIKNAIRINPMKKRALSEIYVTWLFFLFGAFLFKLIMEG